MCAPSRGIHRSRAMDIPSLTLAVLCPLIRLLTDLVLKQPDRKRNVIMAAAAATESLARTAQSA